METTCAGPGDDAGRDPIEALAQSFLERLRRGERPSVDEYAATHPELAGEIRDLLPALERLERDRSVVGEATSPRPAGPRAATLRGAPRQLGDYTILREVGRGAMGVVYEAVQQSLGRQVALKVLRWPEVGSPALLERFRLEARSAAKLHHTNIVPVFGVGESEGMHYYAMQFIEGQGLDAVIGELGRLRDARTESADCASPSATIAATIAREMLGGPASLIATATDGAGGTGTTPGDAGPVPPADAPSTLTSGTELAGAHDRRYFRRVARLALQVADGLAYAHGQGVLHRDIKPSNLLVDACGTVWITDFGLAKAEGSDGPTCTGDILGTLRYMAPERFEGRSDRRGDVYALGATLYELLTLRPLHGEVNRAQLLDRIRHEPPASPRRLDRRIPRDLETIVLKALAKEPGQRYQDAGAMAAELRRFTDDRPILTRRVSTAEQVWRWCRRNPVVAGLLATVLALLVGGTIAAGLAANHFRNLARSEKRARERADLLARTEREANERASRRAAEAQVARVEADVRAREARAARVEADARAREARAVADFLVMDLIGAAAPGKGQGTQMTVGEALARADAAIDRRFAAEPLLAATIHHRMGETYWNLQDKPKAERHLRAAAGLRAEHLGPDARETLLSRQQLFVVLRDMDGRQQEARTIGENVLERQRRALGPEDPDTLVTMGEIGGFLIPWDDDRAPEYYRRLHEALARVKGPVHLDTVNALHWYAWAFLYSGHPARAAEILRQALELRIRGSGEVDMATLWTMGDLIDADYQARKYDVAWTDAERCWPALCRGVAPDHPEHLRLTGYVLDLAAATSDWARAESLFRQEAKVLAADLGAGHVRTLLARSLLARSLAEQGRAGEAVPMARELIEAAVGREAEAAVEVVYEHALTALDRAGAAGSVRDDLARRLRARADRLIASGKTEEAIRLLLLRIRLGLTWAEDYDDLRRVAGKLGADPRVTSALRGLANSYHNRGRQREHAGRKADAEAEYRRSLAIYRKLAEDDPRAPSHRDDAASLEGNLSVVLRRLGRAAEARELCERAVAAREALVREDPASERHRRMLVQHHLDRGLARRALGDVAGAAADARRAAALNDALPTRDGQSWFTAACAHAAVAGLAGRPGSGVPADVAAGEADAAMARLHRAVAKGYRDPDAYRDEDALDPLHCRDDFQLLMMDLAMPADPFALPR